MSDLRVSFLLVKDIQPPVMTEINVVPKEFFRIVRRSLERYGTGTAVFVQFNAFVEETDVPKCGIYAELSFFTTESMYRTTITIQEQSITDLFVGFQQILESADFTQGLMSD